MVYLDLLTQATSLHPNLLAPHHSTNHDLWSALIDYQSRRNYRTRRRGGGIGGFIFGIGGLCCLVIVALVAIGILIGRRGRNKNQPPSDGNYPQTGYPSPPPTPGGENPPPPSGGPGPYDPPRPGPDMGKDH